ncbi:hypothetical protein FRC18_003876 [Serendipita sp. 400]|nr:hypothetical protein FRC18_003876 [Serendipita sp. 400]
MSTSTAPNQFTKTLVIKTKANTVPKAVSLMLTFDKIPGLLNEQQSVCWKVVKFPAAQEMSVAVTYKSQLCFVHPQISAGNIISASTTKNINVGEQTDLIVDKDSGVSMFTNPKPGRTGENEIIRCENKTGGIRDLSIGLRDSPDADPGIALYFPGVGTDSSVAARFTPVLRGFVTSNYVESEIIRGEIESGEVLHQNLASLADKTVWYLQWDGTTGQYSLVKAS